MSLGPNQVLGNLLSDAVDPHSWRTKKMLCEEDEAETEASGVPKCAVLIYHLLAHLESPMWPTQACGSSGGASGGGDGSGSYRTSVLSWGGLGRASQHGVKSPMTPIDNHC